MLWACQHKLLTTYPQIKPVLSITIKEPRGANATIVEPRGAQRLTTVLFLSLDNLDLLKNQSCPSNVI